MAKSFRQALLERVAPSDRAAAATSGKPSLKKVAEGAGVSYEQLKKVRQRNGSTNVDDAVKVANWFGLTLDEFLGDETATIRAEIVDLYNQLSEKHRAILLGEARAYREVQDRDKRPPRPGNHGQP